MSEVKVLFAPGVLETLPEYFTAEEQQVIMDQIAALTSDPNFLVGAEVVDIADLDPEMAEYVTAMLDQNKVVANTVH